MSPTTPIADRNRHAAGTNDGTNAIGGRFAPEDPKPEGPSIDVESAAAEIEAFIANATLDHNMSTPLNLDPDEWLILSHADGDFDGGSVGFDSLELHYYEDDGLEAVAVSYLDATELNADSQWLADHHDAIRKAFDEAYPGADLDIEGEDAIARLDVAGEDSAEPITFRDALTLIANDEVANELATNVKADRVWAPVRAKLAEVVPTPMPLTEIRPGDAVYDVGFLGIVSSIDTVTGTFRPTTDEEANRPQIRVGFASGSGIRGDAADKLVVDRSGQPLPYEAGRSYWQKVSAAADSRQEPEVLFQIAVDEPEDDFKLAIARNPKAQADALDIVAEYHGHPSRLAVIAHPNTARQTVQRLLDEAILEEKAERQRAKSEGVSPMQGHYIAMADSAALVATAASARLDDAAPSTSKS